MSLVETLRGEMLLHDETSGWERRQVTEVAAVRKRELLAPFRRAWLGPQSLTIGDLRRRDVAVPGGITDGQMARAYLRRQLSTATESQGKKVDHIHWSRGREFPELMTPPYWWRPLGGRPLPGPWSIVDVDACYWTISSRLALDMVFDPTTSPPLLGFGRIPHELPGDIARHKRLRNAIVGSMTRRTLRDWRHGVEHDTSPNRLYAPDHVGLVIGCVHQIAHAAVTRFGAVSWSVDGGAFRPDAGEQFISWLSETWGLAASVRATGPGVVWSPNAWSVGALETLDVEHGHAISWDRPHSSVSPLPVKLVDQLARTMKERSCCGTEESQGKSGRTEWAATRRAAAAKAAGRPTRTTR